MKYLVPYDFSPISRISLDHAISILGEVPGKIELLHIVDKDEKKQHAEFTLTGLIASLSEDVQEHIDSKVLVGDIYSDIAKEAEDADLLVMGTHGAKGLQKIFGSRAVKIITSSNTPFLITQLEGPKKEIEKIVLPVDLSKESLQIVEFTKRLAKRFSAEIHVVCEPEEDEFMTHKLRNNINWVKMKLANEINFEVETLAGKKSFAQDVIDYGEEHGADLFAITHFSDSILPQFDTFTQEMITNRSGTPVLVIEGKQMSDINTNYTFIGM